jgi:hypothetical protein
MRVLLLGATGVDKAMVAHKLREAMGSAAPQYVDFEKDFLIPGYGDDFYKFLDDKFARQKEVWGAAWRTLMGAADQGGANIIVGLHASYTRPLYGTRSPVSIPQITEFRPDKIVTLIDDIYYMWHRTESRAGTRTYMGKPKISALLEARCIETFMGDLIASHVGAIDHFVVAVRHPVGLLQKLLFQDAQLKVSYLAFPISKPREMLQAGDASGVAGVNGFLHYAYLEEARHKHHCFFCPLSIDELPMLPSTTAAAQGTTAAPAGGFLVARDRWDTSAFWDHDDLLLDVAALPSQLQIEPEDVRMAEGMVRTDLDRRDCRLVRQADRVVAWNPVFRKNMNAAPKQEDDFNRGERKEIQLALDHRTPVLIYQDPAHDPEQFLEHLIAPPAGSLGGFATQAYVQIHHDWDAFRGELFD